MILEKILATHETAGIGSRITVNDGTPDVKVLASTAVSVGTTGVTELGARVDIISVDESEAHVLQRFSYYVAVQNELNTYTRSVVSTARGAKGEFITFRSGRVNERCRRVSTAVLDVDQGIRKWLQLLTTHVGLLCSGVHVTIHSTLEVRTWV